MIAGRVVAGAIVWTPEPGMAKVIVSPPIRALASRIAWRSEPAPLSLVLVTTSVSGPATVTVVVAVAELFAGTGSCSSAWTVAVLLSEPMAPGVPTIDSVALAPLASVPRVHVKTGVNSQVPDDALTLNDPLHTVLTRTFVAGFGPLFVIVIV